MKLPIEPRRSWLIPLLLLGACLLGYGLLLPGLGFYWDDWPILWIGEKLGQAGLERYFATNRPFWGMLFEFTIPLLGTTPWGWQIFAIIIRWLCGVFLWLTLRRALPDCQQIPAWSALLFVVYPSFDSQAISLVYGHNFLVLLFLLVSFYLNLRSLKTERWRWLPQVASLFLALANLLAMEFYFLLELLRPLLLWFGLQDGAPDRRTRIRKVITAELPYLTLFLGATIWRAFFFKYQTLNYQTNQVSRILQAPLQAIPGLLGAILGDWWTVLGLSWIKAFTLPDFFALGARADLMYAAASITAGAAVVAVFWPRQSQYQKNAGGNPFQPIIFAFTALLLAGGPFWAVGMAVGLEFPNSRFTLPFMLGASLLLAGLLVLIPTRWRWVQVGALGLAVAAAVGMQFRSNLSYQRDWSNHNNFFWQMSWRIPQLKSSTTVLANGLPMKYFSDNSLVAPLNYIYAPENRSQQMSLMFFNPALRIGRGLPALEKGHPIEQGYLAASFSGSTSQVMALVFSPPACLRVLDPDLDPLNPTLPPLMAQSAAISNPAVIGTDENRPAGMNRTIFGVEPAHRWCFYFEKAELARQKGDWQEAARLGELAFKLGDYPNDPVERWVFIEAYARTLSWPRSIELTRETNRITPLLQLALCRLWQRIDEQMPVSAEKTTAVLTMQVELNCSAH